MTDELGDPADKVVLVVDDDESIRAVMDHILKKEGFKVEMAEDGDVALRKINAVRPSLILLDLMLPRYGGFEILRQLQSGECAMTPIVVVTGRYTDRSTSEMIRQESNVVGFMEKPVQPAVLAATLHRILKTRPPELKKSHG